MKKQRDGRWFAMHTSRGKGFNGLRTVGTCCGSFECVNTQCPKLISGKGAIQGRNKGRTCQICGEEAIQITCGAKRVTEFHPFQETLFVYHVGEHKFTLKRRTEKEYTEQQLDRNIGRSSKQATIDTDSYYLVRWEVDEAV